MAMRYPGLAPRVRSGLLGRYDPSLRRQNQMYMNRTPTGGGAGGLNLGSFKPPELSELSAKYLKGIPQSEIETDASKLYEQQVGGMRSDVESALTQGGQQAISAAAASGREVADVMARYLPEAVKGAGRGYADVATSASQQAQQGQVAKSEMELKRQGMANEMARFDQAAQQQQYQFMQQLQTEYQMNRERMANNLRVAQAQAQSGAQQQSIANAHQMQMQQLKNQFTMKAQQFSEAQQNARQAHQLRAYDRWQQADYQRAGRQQTLAGMQSFQQALPQFTPGGSAPQSSGLPGSTAPSTSWSYTGGIAGGTPEDIYKQMEDRDRYYRQIASGDYGYMD